MCYSPLPAYQISDNFVKIFPRDTMYIYCEATTHEWIAVSKKDAERYPIAPTVRAIPRDWLMMINCGKCLDCRLKLARDWANRCILEADQYEDNYFLTLTYEDSCLPMVHPATGEALDHATLFKNDVTQFLKSLRWHWSEYFGHVGIRFFMAGEYGDLSMRPHYHMIVFNLPIPDLKVYKKSALEDTYYTSDIINRIWHKGYVVIGHVTQASAGYTARYTLKKINQPSDYYDTLNILPEYVNMSRRPGIARNWYDKNKDLLFKQGFVSFATSDKGVRIYPGRYFKSLYKNENEADYLRFSELQTYKAIVKRDMELKQTTLDSLEYDFVKMANAEKKKKILFKRELI